jgi:hypothetical protein
VNATPRIRFCLQEKQSAAAIFPSAVYTFTSLYSAATPLTEPTKLVEIAFFV